MRFMLIDRILEWIPGDRALAVKNVSLSEDFFDDHFPLKPIMPGALILEGMAQISGILIEETVRRQEDRNIKALMSIVEKAKFRQPVYPGDSMRYHAEVVSVNDAGGRAAVRATVDGKKVAECALLFSFHEVDNPQLDAIRARVLKQWLEGAQIHG